MQNPKEESVEEKTARQKVAHAHEGKYSKAVVSTTNQKNHDTTQVNVVNDIRKATLARDVIKAIHEKPKTSKTVV